MITDEEAKNAFNELSDLTEDYEDFREHLCSLLISHAKDAFSLRFFFNRASFIENKTVRNQIWLHAIKKGTEIYKTIDKDSKEGREEIGDLAYMDQAFKDYCNS